MIFFFFKILLTVSFYLFLGKLTVNKILKYEDSTIFDYFIIGIITVSVIALIINFFFPLNITTNSILFFCIYFYKYLFLQIYDQGDNFSLHKNYKFLKIVWM
mgnify:CR=1 FL=1